MAGKTRDSARTPYEVEIGVENGIYYVVRSDITGLNIEAETYASFVEAVIDVTPDLIDHASRRPAISFWTLVTLDL